RDEPRCRQPTRARSHRKPNRLGRAFLRDFRGSHPHEGHAHGRAVPMKKPEQYLRPEVIQQVARLDLRAKFIVEGFLTGLHASPFQGFSVEFSEHRKYVPGDDLKTLDWSVYAKTGKYFVKKFRAETN